MRTWACGITWFLVGAICGFGGCFYLERGGHGVPVAQVPVAESAVDHARLEYQRGVSAVGASRVETDKEVTAAHEKASRSVVSLDVLALADELNAVIRECSGDILRPVGDDSR